MKSNDGLSNTSPIKATDVKHLVMDDQEPEEEDTGDLLPPKMEIVKINTEKDLKVIPTRQKAEVCKAII